ncbi:tRNA pseudouridine(38-40) synthase TruA [Nemorincola caseinilytica]|uniref:tRNA pseudouridine synthase A n=1 Tax=Nemorincola caseinilytica TaxID=2054315 RepID=A0ABP8N5T5_9BACT
MARYVLEVMYDGTCFHGSQVQGELQTVQLLVNKVLSTLYRTPMVTIGASRTDEGVHALSNFFHFDADTEPRPDLVYKCNAILPSGMAVKNVYHAPYDFNARFHAIERSYRYKIYAIKDPFLVNRALYYPFRMQEDLLHEAAAVLKGYSQFQSFAKRNSQVHTFDCTINTSRWERHGKELHYVVSANRFLRGMVRGLVATQLRVARGSMDMARLRQIIEARDCTKAFFDVTGHGLYLEEVSYPEGILRPLGYFN